MFKKTKATIILKNSLLVILLLMLVYLNLFKTNATEILDNVYDDKHYHQVEETSLQKITSTMAIIDDNVWNMYNQSYFKEYDITLDGITKSYFILDNYLYVLLNNNKDTYLKKINLTNKEEEYVLISGNLSDMMYINDIVYIVGGIDEDAIIYMYNLELGYLSQYQYGGENNETFTNIYVINQDIYIFGQKDAISKGSVFSNVGNTNEIKSFIVKLGNDMKIDKAFYVNEGSAFEEITSLVIKKNYIYFIVHTQEDMYYQYILNLDLEISEKYALIFDGNMRKVMLLDSDNLENENIYIYQSDNQLYYVIFTNQIQYVYLIKEDIQNLYYSQIKNGRLDIYYSLDGIMKNINILEYHILFQNSKEVYYLDKDYDSTNHFLVTSYFQDLNFEYDKELNEHIILNKSQSTIAYYSAISKCGQKITIQTPYIVYPYINIINNGVYSLGYQLFFSDDVYINDKKIYNGEKLSNIGYYNITHVTNIEDKTLEQTYTIYVCENYYKALDINYLNSTIDLNYGEQYCYEINLSTNKKVNQVIVNNESYLFVQNKKKIQIFFPAIDIGSIKEYQVEKIIFDDGTKLEINDFVKIRTKKRTPIIDIYYQDGQILYNIDDIDQSIVDLKIKYYQSDFLIKEEMTYLQTYNVVLFDEKTKIEIVLLYEDGTKIINEEVIFELEGFTDKKEKNIFQIEYDKSSTIKQISFNKIDSSKATVLTSNILEISLDNLFIKETNLNFFIIIILITLVIIILAISIFIFKKHKK